MNFHINVTLLEMPGWSGVQVYVYRVLEEMIALGQEHTFHLQLGRRPPRRRGDFDDRIDALVARTNVVRHWAPRGLRFGLYLPFGVLRSRSRVYYLMGGWYGDIKVPLPCRTAALVFDCGRHRLPAHYGVADPEALRREDGRNLRARDLIITISQTVKGEIIDLFGVDPDRIVVAPCAAEPPDSALPSERPAGLPENAPFFLMVNPGRSYKNWQDALAGFSCYLARNPGDQETRLVLAGDLRGEAEPVARTLTADPQLAARVLCLGFVSEPQLRYVYRRARLAISPSRFEGFGMPALEAMAHDLPVIVSDIPVFREVACDAALRVPLDQPEAIGAALERLNSDDALRAALVEQGRKRVDAYSWRQSAQITLNALTTLGERRPAA